MRARKLPESAREPAVVGSEPLGAVESVASSAGRRAKLIKQDVTTEMTAASERRIIAYQALYAFGALLSVFNPYLSIGFIVAVQLNAAITPRIWRLDRF